jgi:3-methyl-2-oxobutanoate hydroxymethyltransferase
MSNRKVTVLDVQQAKEEGRKLVMVTAYDYPLGLLAAEAEVDIVLVGDSLGMVVMGMEGTVEVTMEHMIHHTKAVVRGCKGPLIVGDMPFMSYNTSIRDAIINAGRLLKEGNCEVVKLEGGIDFAVTIEAIVKAGIPVMGHIGLTPQTASALGGFKIQGRDASAAKQIIDDARALEDAGVFSIILEAVPAPLGKLVAETVKVPVIGIGAGPEVDGQVLVIHDVVGLFDRFVPKFVKQYANVRKIMLDALNRYKQEVSDSTFPGPEHSFKMPGEALEQLKKMIST